MSQARQSDNLLTLHAFHIPGPNEFMKPRVRVKVCGMTSVEAAVQAAAAGADAIGLVFYEPSPRNLADLGKARAMALAAGPFVTVTGLFVNPAVSFVERVLAEVPLGALQFHGDEEAAFCARFGRPYIKALRMRSDLDPVVEMTRYPDAIGILLDAYRPGTPGGTGETFDWTRVPKKTSRPVVLAGGLGPDNVAQAIAISAPWAVDVSGGVEGAPGIKDPQKVTDFIRAVAAASLSS